MEKRLILRGILAGALGGLIAYVFARIFAEPLIDKAIAYESARDSAQQALDRAAGVPVPAEMGEVFTRTMQANVGIGVGMVAFGAAIGALAAVAFCFYYGHVGRLRPRTLALLVAGGGFTFLYLVPFLKYPANPPAIGHSETIDARTGLYLTMIVCSLVCGVGAVRVGQLLAQRWGNLNATLAVAGGFIVVMGIVMALLPSLGDLAVNQRVYGHFGTETPQPLTDANGRIVFPGFPADVLFRFRLYSIGAQLLMWGTIGLVFGTLAERVLAPSPAVRTEPRRGHGSRVRTGATAP